MHVSLQFIFPGELTEPHMAGIWVNLREIGAEGTLLGLLKDVWEDLPTFDVTLVGQPAKYRRVGQTVSEKFFGLCTKKDKMSAFIPKIFWLRNA